eukprot:TRINITY_DN202_c0_g1_i1.p1 TRINITY_DN202_c0_g1~~TRINITY_DN202_c0_g1_i1.p1  ORF type:complete len:82 (+),score=10.00 TRINITY_DN202_c0_g1_i1:488-733(+)
MGRITTLVPKKVFSCFHDKSVVNCNFVTKIQHKDENGWDNTCINIFKFFLGRKTDFGKAPKIARSCQMLYLDSDLQQEFRV